jgi:AcrR family transcriptional regulator
MSRPILKKDHISQAALKLFVERGIEGTTTREIALAANAGEGTMFRHFESKEDLAWHLFDGNLKDFMKRLTDRLAPLSTAKQRIQAMVSESYSLYETDPTLCSFLLLTEHSAARRMEPGYRTPIALLVETIEVGQKSGEIRPMDPQLAAALVFGAALRVPLFKRHKRIQGDLRERVEEVMEAVWKMVSNDDRKG